MHFSITGEALTRFVRDLMLDQRPAHAWRCLTDGIDGMSEKQVRSILSGTHRFESVERGMFLVADSSEAAVEYVKSLRYIYAGRVRLHGRWWRPRAKVTSFGPEDVRAPKQGRVHRNLDMRRVEHYAGPDELAFNIVTDLAMASNRCSYEKCGMCDGYGEESFIFEPCGEPPHWWEENKSVDEALKDCLASGRKLDETGWMQTYADTYKSKLQGLDIKCKPVDPEWAKKAQREAEALIERDRIAREKAEFDTVVVNLRRQIREQAGDDLVDLGYDVFGDEVRAPRAALVNWALRGTALSHLAPPWKPCASAGLKMGQDDPFHTDWWVGAGFEPEDAYPPFGDKEQRDWDERFGRAISAAWREKFRIQKELGNFSAGVVVDAGPVEGRAGDEILVLPNLHPDYLERALKAKAIITEAGGALAHLAVVAMERNITIMRVENACTKFPEGSKLRLEPATGKISFVNIENMDFVC